MADASHTSQPDRDARVVSEHLPAGYGATFDGSSEPADTAASSAAQSAEPDEISSLKLPGGDVHRDLFMIQQRAERAKMHQRSNTFHYPQQLRPDDDDEEGLAVSSQMAPGGFRRAFIQQQQQNNQFLAARLPITRNFVEFLDLYGAFAGEDLADSDDEAIVTDDEEEEGRERAPEQRPLLGRRRTTRAARTATASTTKTFFTLLKAFIGTGIMFLPKAFSNGGLAFSSITMVVVSTVTMISFHLLLKCKQQHSGGYGEIGEAIAGRRLRNLIMGSITFSQLGFVCAGIVFVAENIEAFGAAVTKGDTSPVSSVAIILFQLAVLIPLSWIRNISKLGPAALLADVFIMIGVTYIYYYDIGSLASNGIHKTVVMFNPDKYTMMIGSAIFTFEGIGLILPIQSSMAKPEKFEPLLGLIMLIITIIFTSVGALCYATFGNGTYIEIINNYPRDSRFVQAMQFLYSLAILVGNPVQLFPALRIIEGGLFGRHSGKKSLATKWTKNGFRTLMVLICGGISILGAGNLDRFVALIGSFACVPLVYIYPPYLHYRGVATSKYAKIGDVILMILGVVCMVYTTVVTIKNSFM
jgi:solute carrier family 36 (proton-coupled amino acid transporter)